MTMHSNPLGTPHSDRNIRIDTEPMVTASMETFLASAGSLVFFSRNVLHGHPVALASRRGLGVAPGVLISFFIFYLFIFYFILPCTHPSVVSPGFMVHCSLILLLSWSRRRIFSRAVCKRGGHHLMARGFLFFAFCFLCVGTGRKRRTLYIKIITSLQWTFDLMSLTSIPCSVSCSHYH